MKKEGEVEEFLRGFSIKGE